VGYALKLAQRAQALDHGITVVRWTFDPLVARNAWFNLGKLGAVADRFHRNFYGEMADVVNRGERSDRLVIRWDLVPEPGPWTVPLQGDPVILRREGATDAPRPGRVGDPSGDAAIVEVPAEYHALRERDRELATAWRDALADAIEACVGVGMVAMTFARDRSNYVFARTRSRAREATSRILAMVPV
jgi:predicted GNAT superfamily acetyltransferase